MTMRDDLQAVMEAADDAATTVDRLKRTEQYRAVRHPAGSDMRRAIDRNETALAIIEYHMREAAAEACAVLGDRERLPVVEGVAS